MPAPSRRIRIRRPRRLAVVTGEPKPRAHGAQSPRKWFPGMTCAICGEAVRAWQPFNFDHQVPMSKGGRRGKANKTFTHTLCNSVKGDRYPFNLRTPAEREAVRAVVSERTYARLERTWRGA